MALALLLDISRGGYWEARDAILNTLKKLCLDAQVRGGAVIGVSDIIRSIHFSSAAPNSPRLLERYSRARDAGVERWATSELLRTVRLLRSKLDRLPDVLGASAYECLSVSNLGEVLAYQIISIPEVESHLKLAMIFDDQNRLHRAMLWDLLVLSGMSIRGERFDSYQDAPERFEEVRGVEVFVADPEYKLPENSDGWFYDVGRIYFDSNNSAVTPAAGLPALERLDPVVLDPVTRAMASAMSSPTTRVSSQDDLSVPAFFRRADFQIPFADPMADEAKVLRYCLNPAQQDQKWRGFAANLYRRTNPSDSFLLAAMFAGALQEPFSPTDARTTADGSLQFGMTVALPRRSGGYVYCQTAWVVGSDSQPRLSTAFITSRRSDSATRPPVLPPLAYESNGSLFASVRDASDDYANYFQSDSYLATGSVWIRHDDFSSKAFASWVRDRERSYSGGTFTRRRWGGRVTQMHIGGFGALRTAAWISRAQVLLLLAGVRTHVELWVD